MYHGITDKKLPTFYWTQLPIEKFRYQMKILKKGYNVISPESLYSKELGRLNYPKNSVIITFDDGYENLINNAWEVLKNFRLPATIFVVTELSKSREIIWTDLIYNIFIKHYSSGIDLSMFGLKKYPKCNDYNERIKPIEQLKTNLKNFSEKDRKDVIEHLLEKYPLEKSEYFNVFKLLSVEQIIELSKSKEIQIASHSHHHPILSTLSPKEQTDEIESSMEALALWKIPKTNIFAYPNGRHQDFNEHTIMALERNGIAIAVTTVEGFNDISSDLFKIKRIAIGADIDNWEFKAKLSGLYYFIFKIIYFMKRDK